MSVCADVTDSIPALAGRKTRAAASIHGPTDGSVRLSGPPTADSPAAGSESAAPDPVSHSA